MGNFQCIHCGKMREQETEGACPACGYRMFACPYDRSLVLRSEIQRSLRALEKPPIQLSDLFLYRMENGKEIPKAADEKRFPGFETVQDYVCKAKKTEEFLRRLNQSIEELRGHLRTPFGKSYQVSVESIRRSVQSRDEILRAALTALRIQERPQKPELPEMTADYMEMPDPVLLPMAEKTLDMLLTLAQKIGAFIRMNNLYGLEYRGTANKQARLTGSPAQALEDLNGTLKKILSKRYVLDLFDDGTPQLEEMLGVLWQSFQALMKLPILQKSCQFTLADGTQEKEETICAVLQNRLERRFSTINQFAFSPTFLQEISDEPLFNLYDQMIHLVRPEMCGVPRESLAVGKSEAKLQQMIGLSAVKTMVRKIKAYALANRDSGELNLNMCFLGHPGTGKTEAARLIAGILYENEILPTDRLVEVDRSGLVSQYFGATAEKTKQVIASAMGGVLFVDEAYALGSSDVGNSDYGREAINTLVKAMEDSRGKLCVIFAGYKNEMEKMLSVNPGMRSRIPFVMDFPDYSRRELQEIAELMLEKQNYRISCEAMTQILDITDIRRKAPNFANAREIRNIIDQTILCQNLRTNGSNREIGLVDVLSYIENEGGYDGFNERTRGYNIR